MSNRVTDILDRTAKKYSSDSSWLGKSKEIYLEHLNKHTTEEISKITDEINKKESGDSFNKKVDAKSKYYQDRTKNTLSPYLKRKTQTFIKNFVTSNPDALKAQTELYNKYIDNMISNACSQIDQVGKSVEEYRIISEALIRAYHDNLNNDPELQKAIKTNITQAIQDAAVSEVIKDMNSFQIVSGKYIDVTGKTLNNTLNNTLDSITNINIDNTIALSTTRTVNRISSMIANDTFGRLTNIPIVGTYFSSLQKVTESLVSQGTESLIKKQLTNLAPQIASIKAYQTKLSTFQQAANTAIEKAQEKAKEYTQKLEQKAIDEIKKFINLDNLSIGGFKL